MFIFPWENNTGLPPVPFHHHSPLHTLKVTDISVKLNRMQCKQTNFVSRKNENVGFEFKETGTLV